ncbi:MAG: lysophospholipid acyltransferase family protein [Cellvibrionaceae bacterium]
MINIEKSVIEKFPSLERKPALIKNSTISVLRKLTHEQEINLFLEAHQGTVNFDFIDRIFDYFNFSYSASSKSKANIPASGRVVIIANHPIGSLDGLALLRLISEVRRDVKIIANDMLMAFEPLHSLLLPLDNMKGGGHRKSYKRILESLNNDEAVIIFPAGEVSRVSPQGIRDGKWHSGFLSFARKTQSSILPIFVEAQNSLLFYSASIMLKPLGTALLAHEMFNKRSGEIRFKVGEPIPPSALDSKTEAKNISDQALIKRLKKHLYKLRKNRKRLFITEKTIAHPEERQLLKNELKQSEHLGTTRDNNRIFLCDYRDDSSVIREIGRLRELTFRKVGEGTGNKRDLDRYDQDYRHLVLWDEESLDIAGSYRIGEAFRTVAEEGIESLYTAELFHYHKALTPYLEQGLELGRSFVNAKYWGKASLDYLWQGIGAYLRHNSNVRYLIGPVSMSADYSRELKNLLVYYYQHYYAAPEVLASAKRPYLLDIEAQQNLSKIFLHMSREEGFSYLQEKFAEEGVKLPVLFKQYAALFEKGGFQLLAFNIDPDFADCVDGLFIADLTTLKANKRKRYIGE